MIHVRRVNFSISRKINIEMKINIIENRRIEDSRKQIFLHVYIQINYIYTYF